MTDLTMRKTIEGTRLQLNHNFGVYEYTKTHNHRVIGAMVVKSEANFVASNGGYGYRIKPGHYYMLDVRATRDGIEYGASQPSRHFTTADARNRAADKYLAGARKRAEKRKV